MLYITPAQLNAFGDSRRRTLKAQLSAHLAEQHPSLLDKLSPEAVGSRLDHVVEAGEQHGLISVRAFAYLAALMFRFGPGVPRCRLIEQALAHGPTPDKAMARLPGRLDNKAWRLVAKEASAGRWPHEHERRA